MIGYITIGTNDFDRSLKFYDELFQTIGVKRLWAHGKMAAWGKSRQDCSFCITHPFNDEPATIGNGAMIAIKVENQEQVKAFHTKALEIGGSDEGQPGPRGDHGFYGGYFRDLDGNKLNAYIPG